MSDDKTRENQASLLLVGGSGERRRQSFVERRIEAAREIDSTRVQNPDYVHSALANVYLPVRNPGQERIWIRRNGGVTLRIDAGIVAVKDTGDFVDVGLPWGSRARLILIYLTTRARQSSSPIVEVGSSLLAFMRRLGLNGRGRDYDEVTDQLRRLLAARINMIIPSGEGRHFAGQVAKEMPLWSLDFRRNWQEEVVLSDDFFQTVKTHAVPLDEKAIALLKNSALGLDVYAWLASRLCRIDQGQKVVIPWSAVRDQFGQETGPLWKFRQTFRTVLQRVFLVYPEARRAVIDEEDTLTLLPAPPPVAQRVRLLKG